MRKLRFVLPVLAILFAACQTTQAPPAPSTAPAAEPSARPETAATVTAPTLPPSESGARAALEASPRHGEYIDVPMPGGTPIRTWVVYPEKKEKAGVALVIMEVYGLSDWIRAVADHLAKEGFVAVAPDLISGIGPGGGGTESVASRDEVVKLVRSLTPEVATSRLNAVHDWAVRLPASNGNSATIGFCWGGARSFAYAVDQPAIDGAVVYYGSSPDAAELGKIVAPVVGFYGSDGARVNATIPPAEAEMKRLGKVYEVNIYEGAGHGFLRQQEDRAGANLRAAEQAWPRTVAFLRQHLR